MEERIENQLDYLLENEEEKESFKITSLSQADWAFQKIKECQDKLQKQEDYVKEQKMYYDSYLKKFKEQVGSEVEYFEGLLKMYLEEEQEKDPSFKLKTAKGSGHMRNSVTWNYDDEKVLDFLSKNGQVHLISYKPSINKTELKKEFTLTDSGHVMTEDGEIIDGITTEKTSKFVVRMG